MLNLFNLGNNGKIVENSLFYVDNSKFQHIGGCFTGIKNVFYTFDRYKNQSVQGAGTFFAKCILLVQNRFRLYVIIPNSILFTVSNFR